MKEITLDEVTKTRENAYKECKEYRKLEFFYIHGFEPKYTKSDEIIDELEDNDVDVDKFQTEESKKAEQEHEETATKARDDHVKTCEICKPYNDTWNEYNKQRGRK